MNQTWTCWLRLSRLKIFTCQNHFLPSFWLHLHLALDYQGKLSFFQHIRSEAPRFFSFFRHWLYDLCKITCISKSFLFFLQKTNLFIWSLFAREHKMQQASEPVHITHLCGIEGIFLCTSARSLKRSLNINELNYFLTGLYNQEFQCNGVHEFRWVDSSGQNRSTPETNKYKCSSGISLAKQTI